MEQYVALNTNPRKPDLHNSFHEIIVTKATEVDVAALAVWIDQQLNRTEAIVWLLRVQVL